MLFYLVFLNVNIYIFNTTIVMIDDKKIEEAAQGTADLYEQDLPIMSYNEDTEVDGQHHFCQEFGAELFKDGAKWAINEFLKDLWHPASEKPNIKQGECCVTCLIKFKNGSTELCVYFRNPEGWVCDDMSPKDFKRNFNGWLYIDELLPRREVNND